MRFNPLPAFGPGDTRYAESSNNDITQFQSAPGFWAGRYPATPCRHLRRTCFNPLPAFGPGDTKIKPCSIVFQEVSIRSRLLGREIRGYLNPVFFHYLFQSAPGFWAGRYRDRINSVNALLCFNPLPAFGPGDTQSPCRC